MSEGWMDLYSVLYLALAVIAVLEGSEGADTLATCSMVFFVGARLMGAIKKGGAK